MKNRNYLLLVLLLSTTGFAQLPLDCDTSVFKCPAIFEDIKSYNSLLQKYKGHNLQWASAVCNAFPTDNDGVIHFTYIIKSDTTFDIAETKAICANWYNLAFSSDQAIKISTDDMISGSGTYYTIAQTTIPAIVYYKIIRVNASTDIVLRFKDNRIKMDIYCRNYTYISGDSFAQSNHKLFLPSEVYPCISSGSNSDKEVYSVAYINCCCYSLSHAKSFLEYVNKNRNKYIEDNNW